MRGFEVVGKGFLLCPLRVSTNLGLWQAEQFIALLMNKDLKMDCLISLELLYIRNKKYAVKCN